MLSSTSVLLFLLCCYHHRYPVCLATGGERRQHLSHQSKNMLLSYLLLSRLPLSSTHSFHSLLYSSIFLLLTLPTLLFIFLPASSLVTLLLSSLFHPLLLSSLLSSFCLPRLSRLRTITATQQSSLISRDAVSQTES